MNTAQLLLAYLAAWLLVTTLLSRKYGEEEEGRIVASPLMLMLRLPIRFEKFERLRGSRVIALILDAGVAALAVLMAGFYATMVRGILARLSSGTAQPLVMPILPGVTISLETFLYLLPGLAVAILFHESAHALAARYEGIPIKSSGIMVLLGLLPAAFVEPDEEQLNSAPRRARLRVYSAGVLANLIVFAILAGTLTALSSSGSIIMITGVQPGTFAAKAGIHGYLALKEIVVNGTAFNNLDSFLKYMYKLRAENGGTLANKTLIVELVTINDKVYRVVKPAAPPGTVNATRYEHIGIYLAEIPRSFISAGLSPSTALKLYLVLLYAELVNIGLAGINAAPLFITDGAQYVRALLEPRLGRENAARAERVISTLTLLLVLPNLAI